MRKLFIAAVFPLALLLSGGCLIRSLNPWLADNLVVKDTSLAGVWYDEKNDTAAFFSAGNNGEYRILVVSDKKDTAAYTGGLYRFGDILLLQVGPKQVEGVAKLPAHLIFRVDADKENMRIYGMDMENFEKLVKTDLPTKTVHGNKSDGFVVSASTAELTEFVKKHLKDKDFFNAKPIYQFQKFSRR